MRPGGKIIIDDSFNGNLSGMLQSYELMRSYGGRKVIITPGIVESTREDNETLAAKINEIFVEVILAARVTPAALAVFEKKKQAESESRNRNISENQF